jgi:predicted nucleic acid-binding protein
VILAFDADVLIYAAEIGHPLGEKVLSILENPNLEGFRIGSALLLPELLSKPIRLGLDLERDALLNILSSLDLIPLDAATAMLAAQLGAVYKLKAPDAIHLATAIQAGSDAFVTNNARDFKPKSILELRVIFPDDLEQFVIDAP